MANVSSNLILFKARQQYGLRVFSEIGLVIFIAVLVLHIFVHTYEMALFARVVAGLAGAPLSSLGMYYTMQAFKKADMAKGIYCLRFSAVRGSRRLDYFSIPSQYRQLVCSLHL